MHGPLFTPELFMKALMVTLGLAVLGLALAYTIDGTLATRDIVGTFISATIIAYMAHLWMDFGREE
ncbi:MAG: hypothetical protein GY841_17035 [FCB group bacterium]|nr:hypothetical protein [FCB group bacterium]